MGIVGILTVAALGKGILNHLPKTVGKPKKPKENCDKYGPYHSQANAQCRKRNH
ncbi:hypothetical protein [Miniphocaeibacter halophilus]|uniref:Uncharacterized protein n=1 Tax=Miniphocaeibacter halophilus TaxID=2931922 RepID=A0AC61MT39_9FIRM|nr:hypothetical protein [Miniphocaeibacter halophilus]QQK07458.1 hypothetical protein JFY71_09085 [Miniphocaeibacter halophilus]